MNGRKVELLLAILSTVDFFTLFKQADIFFRFYKIVFPIAQCSGCEGLENLGPFLSVLLLCVIANGLILGSIFTYIFKTKKYIYFPFMYFALCLLGIVFVGQITSAMFH